MGKLKNKKCKKCVYELLPNVRLFSKDKEFVKNTRVFQCQYCEDIIFEDMHKMFKDYM